MTGSWSAGGDLNTAREGLAGAGSQSASLSFGGDQFADPLNTTEEYNGTSWSSGGNLNIARTYHAGAGSQSTGLAFGGGDINGNNLSSTEEYNGISWSSDGSMNIARRLLAGCGVQDASLSIGGYTTTFVATTEEYNGTAWSSGGDLNIARDSLSGAGSQSAGLSFGGYTGSIVTTTEEYNGTSWSLGGDLDTARYGLAGGGTQTAGLSFGGYDDINVLATTEEYNGTSWLSGGDLNTARDFLGGAGNRSAGLSFGGDGNRNYFAATEEYTGIYFYTWSGSLIQYQTPLLNAESDDYIYLSFYQKQNEGIDLTLKLNLSLTNYQSPLLLSKVDYHQLLSLIQNQSVNILLNLKAFFYLTQNQSTATIILPTYNLLNRDISEFKVIQSLDRPIAYAEAKLDGSINIDLFEPIKIQARSPVNNSMQIMLLGLITDYEQILNQEIKQINIKANDYTFLLARQYINDSYANTSEAINPSHYVKTMLGGDDNWLATTGIYPYNISDVPNWSQDHQFIWDPIKTTKLRAIQDIETWCSMKFFLDYAKVNDVPRPRAYFINAQSSGDILDHFTFDMNNDSTLFTVTKHETVEGYSNEIKVYGYNENLVRITSTKLYANRSFPLEKTYESVFLKNQSLVNERANTLYDAYVFSKTKYEAEGMLRPEIRPGTTLNISNLPDHPNQTFTIYHVEHTFKNGIGNTRFKYDHIPNIAFTDSNKEKTITDIIKETAEQVIESKYINPYIATIVASEGGGLYTIRLENTSTEVKSVHVFSTVSISDKVLYFKNSNVAIK